MNRRGYRGRTERKGGSSAMVIGVISALVLVGVLGAALLYSQQKKVEATRRHGNEKAAIAALRTLGSAQTIFREADRDRNGLFDYGELSELEDAMLIDAVLGTGTKSGYRFVCQPGEGEMAQFLWWAKAEPIEPGVSGRRCFFINQSGDIYDSPKPIKAKASSEKFAPASGRLLTR